MKKEFNCIRKVEDIFLPSTKKTFFLTFDDGPDPNCTPEVLEELDKWKAKATFFVISKNCIRQPDYFEIFSKSGHAIGNHSYDHDTRIFLQRRTNLYNWVKKSEDFIFHFAQGTSVGFRSPVGIITPHLSSVLMELEVKLIHWNIRFFDAVFNWKEKTALKKLEAAPNGSIILLHDSHKGKKKTQFLQTLRVVLKWGNENNIHFSPLSKSYF